MRKNQKLRYRPFDLPVPSDHVIYAFIAGLIAGVLLGGGPAHSATPSPAIGEEAPPPTIPSPRGPKPHCRTTDAVLSELNAEGMTMRFFGITEAGKGFGLFTDIEDAGSRWVAIIWEPDRHWVCAAIGAYKQGQHQGDKP